MAIPAIAELLPALNEAVKTATGIAKLVKDADTKQKVIELQTAIFDLHDRVRQAQTEQDELAKAKDELQRKLMEYDRWDAEAARYKLLELAEGIFVYALKDEHKGNEPAHYLCAHCFGERKRSILQHPVAGYSKYVCHACKFEVNPVKQTFGFSAIKRRTPYDGLLGV